MLLRDLKPAFLKNPQSRVVIYISIADQRLMVMKSDKVKASFSISTALNGAGELHGSEKTPRGWHQIQAKIGHNLPLNSVFVGRRPTGEIYTQELVKAQPNRDWILTRILWLKGLEVGKNRLGEVDSMHRYIYIHGTPDTEPMGEPKSHGCIRMRNQDVIELFNMVEFKTPVLIQEEAFNA